MLPQQARVVASNSSSSNRFALAMKNFSSALFRWQWKVASAPVGIRWISGRWWLASQSDKNNGDIDVTLQLSKTCYQRWCSQHVETATKDVSRCDKLPRTMWTIVVIFHRQRHNKLCSWTSHHAMMQVVTECHKDTSQTTILCNQCNSQPSTGERLSSVTTY